MLYRSKWVASERRKLIKKVSKEAKLYIRHCYATGKHDECDVLEFHRLNYDDKYWSYEKMMFYFWIWDVEKMVNFS
jgi:hypothetical protein